MRTEHDALGPINVPDDRYYGAQTQRACDNFKVGSEKFPHQFIYAHVLLKKAAAHVNASIGLLDHNLKHAITQAADHVLDGDLYDHFPLVIWQSGSGTQFNMNVNEVLASRANELLTGQRGGKIPVHPNDHVNMSQSTNDTIPSSIHLAAVAAIHDNLLPAITRLQNSLTKKAQAFNQIIKIGRTHLQDAVPLTLGQEFSGYAAQLQLAQNAIENALHPLYQLAIGATAVGTGLNAPPDFGRLMAKHLAQLAGHPFRQAENLFAALAGHEPLITASAALKTLAAALNKIANDIRYLASGPRCGLGELKIPANEPGSSIMPGKINPTQCEMVTMVACQIYGNDTTIAIAASQGQFELNAYKPLLAYSLLQSIDLLATACDSFDKRCVAGIEPDKQRIDELLNRSLMLVTALAKHIGYDHAADIALKAHRQNTSLRQAALASGYVSPDDFDRFVKPETMVAHNTTDTQK